MKKSKRAQINEKIQIQERKWIKNDHQHFNHILNHTILWFITGNHVDRHMGFFAHPKARSTVNGKPITKYWYDANLKVKTDVWISSSTSPCLIAKPELSEIVSFWNFYGINWLEISCHIVWIEVKDFIRMHTWILNWILKLNFQRINFVTKWISEPTSAFVHFTSSCFPAPLITHDNVAGCPAWECSSWGVTAEKWATKLTH